MTIDEIYSFDWPDNNEIAFYDILVKQMQLKED